MKSIILHNRKKGLTYLLPLDSINYILSFDEVTRLILKYEINGVGYMDVDETLLMITDLLNM